MGYRLAAEGVLAVHAAFLLFLVFGGFLGWRWRWVVWLHLVAIAWSVPIVVTDAFPCPFTQTEKWLQRRGNEEPYEDGCIGHYLEDRLWPDGYTWVVEIAAFSLIAISYAGLAVRRRRTGRARTAA